MANHSVTHRPLQTNGLHELNVYFPDLEYGKYDDLLQAIKIHGKLHESIIKYDGQILDGRHRLRACKELGIKPCFEEVPAGPESRDYLYQIIEQNVLGRGNLSKGQIALISAGLVVHLLSYNDNSKTSLIEEASRRFTIGRESINRVIDILNHEDSDLRVGIIARLRDKGENILSAWEEVKGITPPIPVPPQPLPVDLLDVLKETLQKWEVAKEKEIRAELTLQMEKEIREKVRLELAELTARLAA